MRSACVPWLSLHVFSCSLRSFVRDRASSSLASPCSPFRVPPRAPAPLRRCRWKSASPCSTLGRGSERRWARSWRPSTARKPWCSESCTVIRWALEWNAEIFRRTLERHPDAALCLEFLTRESQHLVDAYLDGLIEWDAFASACEGIPGTSPASHRPMLEAARAAGVPVVAANAPRLYTTAARRHGYERLENLSDAQQRLFDAPAATLSGPYRDAFRELMVEHLEDPEEAQEAAFETRFEGAFRAQCLWDTTMASSIVGTLEEDRRPAFLVVGSFHCNRDGGTVQSIREQRPGTEILVVTFVAEDAQELLEEHRTLADFVAYVGPHSDED